MFQTKPIYRLPKRSHSESQVMRSSYGQQISEVPPMRYMPVFMRILIPVTLLLLL